MPLTVWVQDSEMKPPASSPDTQIVPFGWDWRTFHRELLRAQARGEAPDVVEIGDTWTSRLVAEGLLLDITRFATERLNAARLFFPRMLRLCTDQPNYRYHALPLLADVRILFYNHSYVEPYLAEHPNAFQNWKAFEDMCQAVQTSLQRDQDDSAGDQDDAYLVHGDRYAIAWPLGPDAFHDALPWIWAMGGDIISASGEVLLDSERTQIAIRRLARLILTDCAPVPPHPPVKDLGEVRTQFRLGRFAIIAGALWVMHGQGSNSWFNAALHPPDPFLTAFVGGSNVAIVRKHGDDEMSDDYEPARQMVESAVTSINDQVRLARRRGKMPCNISAWQHMKQQEKNASARSVLQTFEHAMDWTIDRGLPNVPNLVDIEESLKACMQRIWLQVGSIKRNSQGAPIEELERTCGLAIAQELTATRRHIEPFLTSCTIQYSRQEVEALGLEPPGTFDIWLELRGFAPNLRGVVYVRGGERPVNGIGQTSLQLLRTLVNAPSRMTSRDELITGIWGHNLVVRDHQRIRKIDALIYELATIIRSMQTSVSNLGRSKELLRAADICEEIKHITAGSDERLKKLDTLRHGVDNLNQGLGAIRGNTAIERKEERGELYYGLNRDLSVCVVLP